MNLRRTALLVLVAALLFGCTATRSGGSGSIAAAPTVAVATTQSTATPRPSPTATPSPSPRPTVPAGSLSLVGLGDSLPGGLRREAPCRSYVEVYGKLASTTLKKPVLVTNLATNDGLISSTLASRVKQDDGHRAAIAAADLITITIGVNDFQGPCDWSNHRPCLANGTEQVRANLGRILDEIESLRAGKPTAIRVTTYYDWYLGNGNASIAWGYPATDEDDKVFHAMYAKALADFNAMVCDIVTTHAGVCVDLLPAFNGRGDKHDAADLLGEDHLHPSKAGHELIAKTIAAAGFEPIE